MFSFRIRKDKHEKTNKQKYEVNHAAHPLKKRRKKFLTFYSLMLGCKKVLHVGVA